MKGGRKVDEQEIYLPKPMTNNLNEEIAKIKKPSLQFELIETDNDEPKVDTYFGGKPFVTNEKELPSCPICKNKMSFVIQLLVPDKMTKEKKLYSFYYCFKCVSEETEGSFAINIYHNPDISKLVTDYEYQPNISRFNVQFLPTYEIPEWDYLEGAYPEVHQKFESTYGERSYEAYLQVEQKVKDYFNDTGFKIKGYPESMDYQNVPHCPITGEKMEPFLSMEGVPELKLNWVGTESYVILFKSPSKDEFAIRCIDFGEDFLDI